VMMYRSVCQLYFVSVRVASKPPLPVQAIMNAPLLETEVEATVDVPSANDVPTVRFALMVAVAVLPLYASQTLIPSLNA
jgi:hypothetical protein